MIEFAIKLVLAHILGDFLFQPDQWVAEKRKNKYRSASLYKHLAVHAAALLILLQFNLTYWKGFLILLCSHYVIDLLKLLLERKMHRGWLFILDQVAHLLMIAAVVYFYHPFSLEFNWIFSPEILLVLTCIVMATTVSAILMRMLMSRWILPEDQPEDSLPLAGKYIGMLERLLVFAFIALGQWAAIGWLIAAKSILRFSDLSRAKDRKLTEYVLIGTLLSFSLAISIGILYNFLKYKV
ncbi:DUF3307 domain-containing protein [Salinimicrobium oceani]|uniref:DUF3307 domain-containing protein n=1 Tax=Salinimicrobium oceani TaxID=2722702 RepID=A0ABX1CW06_9FLAO|nr:DUF3307 domain-containing protein [Salinimicrobium oceani]NJW52475.1 DUF3307 domain-containing protein [Salinimicrobium oceani]